MAHHPFAHAQCRARRPIHGRRDRGCAGGGRAALGARFAGAVSHHGIADEMPGSDLASLANLYTAPGLRSNSRVARSARAQTRARKSVVYAEIGCPVGRCGAPSSTRTGIRPCACRRFARPRRLPHTFALCERGVPASWLGRQNTRLAGSHRARPRCRRRPRAGFCGRRRMARPAGSTATARPKPAEQVRTEPSGHRRHQETAEKVIAVRIA